MGIFLLAMIFAYIAGGIALLLGSGWVAAVAILCVTGVVATLALGLRVALSGAPPAMRDVVILRG